VCWPSRAAVRSRRGPLISSPGTAGAKGAILHTTKASVASDITFWIGVGGFAVVIVREWVASRERRRARPVVICHEDQKRTFAHRPHEDWEARVHLTNESAASAFNVRFGVEMGGVHVPWKHDPANDLDASRVNVLRPGARDPEGTATYAVVIPDAVTWLIAAGRDRDIDEGRSYWAYYQSPAGDWWYTSNPSERSADLNITRIQRRLGFPSRQKRQLDRSLREGREVRSAAIGELRERAERESAADARASAHESQHPPDVG